MEIKQNEKLEILLTKRQKLMEEYALRLSEIHDLFAHDFALMKRRKKHLGGGIIVSIAAFIVLVFGITLAEMPLDGILIISGISIIGIGALVFFYIKNEKKYLELMKEYQFQKSPLDGGLEEVSKIEKEAHHEIMHVISLTKYSEELKDADEKKIDEHLEKTKKEIAEKLTENYQDAEIIEYYRNWKAEIAEENSSYDSRKEKLAYLNRKVEQNGNHE